MIKQAFFEENDDEKYLIYLSGRDIIGRITPVRERVLAAKLEVKVFKNLLLRTGRILNVRELSLQQEETKPLF